MMRQLVRVPSPCSQQQLMLFFACCGFTTLHDPSWVLQPFSRQHSNKLSKLTQAVYIVVARYSLCL